MDVERANDLIKLLMRLIKLVQAGSASATIFTAWCATFQARHAQMQRQRYNEANISMVWDLIQKEWSAQLDKYQPSN